MIFRWFSSRAVRHAADMCRRVERILHAQRDLLSPQAISAVQKPIAEVRAAIAHGNEKAINSRLSDLESAANKWLKRYPHPGLRENVDVILVALVVALGIRTFFLQPMAIPTGSMQPTLYGIVQQDLRDQPGAEVPNMVMRVFDALVRGLWYYHVRAESDGELRHVGEVESVFLFFKRQRLTVGDRTYSVWLPPDHLPDRARLAEGQKFRKGDDILKLKVVSGDRLFCDRYTYHFRRPQRGEIVIFASRGLPMLTPDTHYIKRLVGLGGETIRIGNDQHVYVDGQRLDASTPRFENIYTFTGPPRPNQYSGHVNDLVAPQHGQPGIARPFPDGEAEYKVPPNHYLVLGDNTMNSQDSRHWGSVPQDRVVGKHVFVFWPISPRFGWAVR
jgi:signal peptidase I